MTSRVKEDTINLMPESQKGALNLFTRENGATGTVDFVDIFDGGLVIYVKFNTYYNRLAESSELSPRR